MKKLFLYTVMLAILPCSVVTYAAKPSCPTLDEIKQGGLDIYYMVYTRSGGTVAQADYIKWLKTKHAQWKFDIYVAPIRDEDEGWNELKKLYNSMTPTQTVAHKDYSSKKWICDYSEGSFSNSDGGGIYEIYATREGK